jgi:hypothetical protein
LFGADLSLLGAEFLLRRRYYSVWAKFNFVLSAGLDAGTVCSAVFIFFTLLLPKGGTICEFAPLGETLLRYSSLVLTLDSSLFLSASLHLRLCSPLLAVVNW